MGRGSRFTMMRADSYEITALIAKAAKRLQIPNERAEAVYQFYELLIDKLADASWDKLLAVFRKVSASQWTI